jgi:hypothetical protein
MTATPAEQLRTFHITGHGLEEAVPTLSVEAITHGQPLPALEAHYPIRLSSGLLVPFDAEAAGTLPIAALLEARAPRHAAFIETVRRTAERLEDLLALDASHDANAVSPNALTSALGAGGLFLNTANLTAALKRRTTSVHRMTPERRERCQHALTALRQALAVVHPPFALFHAGPVPNPFHGQLHHSADPCSAAVDHARSQLAAMQPTLRALRVARLELEDAYDPAHHDAILDRFRWEAADPSEIAAQPPVIAALTAAEAAALPLQSLSRALHSGCPILIVISNPALTTADLRAISPDLAQIALAHRDAYVLQASLAHPAHLQSALAALSQCLRPAIAVIAVPSGGGWAEAVLLPLAKAWPLFSYDPARGAAWADRFDLQPIEPNSWTAAHAVACDDSFRHHFRTLTADAGDQDPVELTRYLELFGDRPPLAIPFLPAGDARIAVSRDLAEFCHDRLQAYQFLEKSIQRPQAPPEPMTVSREATEQAMRQGAERAVARVVALLSGNQS